MSNNDIFVGDYVLCRKGNKDIDIKVKNIIF